MRRIAVQSVPFSSIFYCSNPLAAALTRRRCQAFFLFIALLHLPDTIKFARWREFTVLTSQRFRFTMIPSESVDKNMPFMISFGITMDGKELDAIDQNHSWGEPGYFNFSKSLTWNGWFFETSPSLNAPTKFSLFTEIDGAWRQVGSSSFVQVADNTLFLTGPYSPSEGRNRFQLSYPGVCGHWLCRISGGLNTAGLFLSGATGRARVGSTFFSLSFFLSFMALQLIEAYSTFGQNGNHSYIPCFILFFVYLGTIPLGLLQGRWIDTFLWQGCCFFTAGILLCTHSEEGRRSGLLLACGGAPFLLLSCGVKLSAVYVRWASRRAISPYARRYAELWAAVLAADDGSEAALRDMDRLLSDFAAQADNIPSGCHFGRTRSGGQAAVAGSFGRTGSGPSDKRSDSDKAPWSVARGGHRQSLPHRLQPTWAGGVLDGAVLAWAGREEYPVLADLDWLYAQAAAADPVLRRRVFGWARRSGGCLPFRQAATDNCNEECVSSSGSMR